MKTKTKSSAHSGAAPGLAVTPGYAHPKSIADFEIIYRREYEQELASSDGWIEWCEAQKDWCGVNFHQGKRAAHVFNNIKMWQLLRILKRESPNA